MPPKTSIKYLAFTASNLVNSTLRTKLSPSLMAEISLLAKVIPFKVNNYVVENLINWDDPKNDPIFCMLFPHKQMLSSNQYLRLKDAEMRKHTDLSTTLHDIRRELNPHPGGQRSHNHPQYSGELLEGLQHKYDQTVLYFPSRGQTCHAYCSFCFRWAQFTGDKQLKMASSDRDVLYGYLDEHQEVSDLLITGGDALVMRTKYLRFYLEPLLEGKYPHIRNIRFGTKALAFWPYRFTDGNDADELSMLLEELSNRGRKVAIMAHISHPKELDTAPVRDAIRRIRDTGATIRSQAPVLRHVNDSSDVWSKMWSLQISMGIIPYYMFVERPTGPSCYFGLPLTYVLDIYQGAVKSISGLGRTARGPVMSTFHGKVELLSHVYIAGKDLFSLRYVQARNADWCNQVFFAHFNSEAQWFNELIPFNSASEKYFGSKGALLQNIGNLRTREFV